MESRVQLVQAENDTSTGPHVMYKKILRSLMYTATEMWLDIAFIVSALAQFVQDPARPTGKPQNVSSDTSKGQGIWNLPMEQPTLELSDTWMPTMPHNTTGIPYQAMPSSSMEAW